MKNAATSLSAHPLALAPETDAEIVAEVLGGATPRFEVLMRRYNQRAYRAARAVLRDDDGAEDAVQQGWLAAYANLAQWDGRARFSTWLLRIVVNAALKRRPAGARDHLELAPDAHRSTAPSPEDETTRSEVRAILERAIDALPETFRVVIVLRDLEELSSAEVGETLGLSEEAVRVRLHRARRALRDGIEDRLRAHEGGLFPFLGERCHRICAIVLAAIRRRR